MRDLSRAGHVRVAEEDGAKRVRLGHARHGRLGAVLEEVLVDAPWAAVDGEQLAEAEHVFGAAALDVGKDGLEARQVAVHVGEDGERPAQHERAHGAPVSRRAWWRG